MGLIGRWRERRELAQARQRAAHGLAADADLFAGVERFVLFIGYPRSGHSLVGSLLDAHPDAAIAHERDVLELMRNGFSREQVFWLLLERAREFTAAGRAWTGYTYAVPNQWNGRFRNLRVLGDKKGGNTARQLIAEPHLLHCCEAFTALPHRYVHVTRNPFDNIATIAKRSVVPLETAAERYMALVGAVAKARADYGPAEWIDLRQEDLIADPRAFLTRLTGFVGLDAPEDYLKDCASIVFAEPRRTRAEVEWSPALRQRIEAAIAATPFLAGYRFVD